MSPNCTISAKEQYTDQPKADKAKDVFYLLLEPAGNSITCALEYSMRGECDGSWF